MNPKELAEVIAASALATLVQLPGIDRETALLASRAIGNNAAQVIGLSDLCQGCCKPAHASEANDDGYCSVCQADQRIH